jgi:hypothetical protein
MTVAIVIASLVGALVAEAPQVAVVCVALVVGLAAFAAPTAAWVAAALVAALTFKGLTTLGVMPSAVTFFDIPLAWGALAVALMRRRHLPQSATLPVGLLIGLSVTVAFSGLFGHSELARPFLYLALLAQPLAVVAAMLIDPPSQKARRSLMGILICLLVIQVPLSYGQVAQGGFGDGVRGTLLGAGAGAHVLSGVAVLGIIWLLARQPIGRAASLSLAALLAPIPFFADAKQVIFALPFTLFVARWTDVRQTVARAAVVGAALLVLLVAIPAGQTALGFLQRADSGQSGKEGSFDVVWSESKSDPASILFGQGPAATVSRAAFLTTDALLAADSPLRAFGLAPAPIASAAHLRAQLQSGGGTSFNSGLSSMLGVFGDIGLIGLVVYSAYWIAIGMRLRRRKTQEADAALAGLVMFVILGGVFDWWEQPPFTVTLAVLIGLALTNSTSSHSNSLRTRGQGFGKEIISGETT